ncbi:MAG: tRNA (adenosine(37)-N6)-dimethylallyltransferase MiaA [Candidatus Babeliaceae bacterium]
MAHFCLIIAGPTGVGKSALAESLAKTFPCDIINADVGQFYVPLSIGTAKPDWKNSDIPHHLFDTLATPCNFSVSEYRKKLLQKLHEVWDKNRIPLIVGGSSFYIRSFFFPPIEIKEEIKQKPYANQELSTALLWQKLHEVDPIRAQALDKNDRYRIMRALTLWHNYQIKPSSLKPVYMPIAPYMLIFATREKQDLYARINKRVGTMLDQGWKKEVMQLSDDWKQFVLHKKIIGYNEIMQALTNEPYNEELLKTVIQQKTRQYAKRQLIFWKSLKRDLLAEASVAEFQAFIHEMNLTLSSLDLYINEIRATINNLST